MKAKIRAILKFIGSFLLFILAYVLFLPLSLLNFLILVFKANAGKYFISSAVNLDRFGNYEFRTLFNLTLKKKNGAEFGNFEETISGVLGKNERDRTLTRTGQLLAWILNHLDKNHCQKSIKNEKL